MAFLPEFLNNNAHRYYPLDPVEDSNLPTALILDMGIIATSALPDNSSTDTTYLSQVVTDGTHVRFYLSADIDGETKDFGCVATANASTKAFDRVDFSPIRYTDNGLDIVFEGFLIIGDTSVLKNMPPVTDLSKEQGKIYTGCIQHMTQWIAGLKINDQILGGIVNLTGGPGVELSVDGNTVEIKCAGTVPPDNSVIVDDFSLLRELETLYGTPITSINGVAVGGDWQITTVDKEGLTVTADPDTHSITITNTLANACCTQDQIQYIVDNIAALNERVAIINSFQTQLDTNLNILSAQMSKII